MSKRVLTLAAASMIVAIPAARGADLTISCGSQSVEATMCEQAAEAWSEATGNTVSVHLGAEQSNERYRDYLDRLNQQDSAIDIYQIDVIWPGAFAEHLLDLTDHLDEDALAAFFEEGLTSNTVDGRLVALPWFADAGLLYYRADLLEKYDQPVPETWTEMAEIALTIMEAEREAGQSGMWGYTFQGHAYEGLTTNALEWIASYGGGSVVEDDGSITVDNPRSRLAFAHAAAWIGSITPERVLQFIEEDARRMFQNGNAVFMRNWPYAWSLLNAEDSPVAGNVGVTQVPRGTRDGMHAAALGGWQLAVSRYSENPELAVEFITYLTSEEEQKRRAIEGSFAPTRTALYQDEELLEASPFLADVELALQGAVARPSSPTGSQYSRVSGLFWEAAFYTLQGNGTARSNLSALQQQLERMRGRGGW